MTNAEKFKEVFGFELNTETDYYCPFNSTKCDNLPCDACIEKFWQSEYQEPNVQAERQKWVDALTRIKSEFHSNYFDDGGAVEELFDDIIERQTKELIE